MACGSTYKNIFALLIFMSIACVIFQYRFNFSSISQCLSNQKRFVATRVVERVFFEMPNTASTANPDQTSFFKNLQPTTKTEIFTSSPPSIEFQDTEPAPEILSETVLNSTITPKFTNQCSPNEYVLFLKTHKTGSSTITNILNRFTDWNNLTMLIPKSDEYYSFDWPNKFRLNFAKNLYGRRPNILANHARYSRKAMNVLFPRDKTFYVSILRHPVKQWESTFNYMSFPYILNILKKEDPLDFFLANPPSFHNIIEIGRRYPSLYLIKNPQFFDLGLDYKYYDNKTMIRRAIRTLEKDFNLVLLMEYFDESLTLLKRRLCWSIDDVVYFKMNERLNKNKRKKLTKQQRRKIYQWNNADVALYDYFSKKFWLEVEKEGPEFYVDLRELKRRKEYYFRVCIEKEAIEEAYTAVFVKGFAMRQNLTGQTKTFCERMLRNELNYQDIFKERYKQWRESLGGLTIENFDEDFEEADVVIGDPISVRKDGEGYRYKRPTRAPKTTKPHTTENADVNATKRKKTVTQSRKGKKEKQTKNSKKTVEGSAIEASSTSLDDIVQKDELSQGTVEPVENNRNLSKRGKKLKGKNYKSIVVNSIKKLSTQPVKAIALSHVHTDGIQSDSPDLPFEELPSGASQPQANKKSTSKETETEVVEELSSEGIRTGSTEENAGIDARQYDGKTITSLRSRF